MASVTENPAFQGMASYQIDLEDGETAVVRLDQHALSWDNGGFSWHLKLGSASSIAVAHSISMDGDHWIADPSSPFTTDRGGNETARIERIRFVLTGDDSEIHVLSPVPLSVVTS